MLSKKFLELICHKWDNLHQAQCWPNEFAHVHYDWWMDNGVLHSKQWYDWNGEVYRYRTHTLEDRKDEMILHIKETKLHLSFKWGEGGILVGTTPPNCYNASGIKIDTSISLDAQTYTSFDKGTTEKGEVLWGKIPSPFIFKHT